MSRALHRFSLLAAAATFLLLGAGGLVTSHGVGMAVPDWPNTFGYNMFFFPVSQWVGGVFYEHTHRLLASGVGLLTAILAIWLHGKKARRFLKWCGAALLALAGLTLAGMPARWSDAAVLAATGLAAVSASFFWPRCEPAAPWLRRLGGIAFLAVVLQGVLGGLRVVLFKDQIGIFHATLAQLFFALMCALALFTSPWWAAHFKSRAELAENGLVSVSASGPQASAFFWLCLATTSLILFQLVLGATMRHQHAGLAIPDFPAAYGRLWPAMDASSVARYNQQRLEVLAVKPITAFQIALQMVHRIAAVCILCAVGLCAWRGQRIFGRRNLSARLTKVWLGLILIQVLLGAATIWSNKAADIATAHVLVGALSLALGAMLSILLRAQAASRASLRSAPVPIETDPSFAARPSHAIGFE